MKVAIVQMVSGQSVDSNLKRLEELFHTAAQESPLAVFLPENFAALASEDPVNIGLGESEPGRPIRRWISEAARAHDFWIFAGTIPCATRPNGNAVDGKRTRAASFVYDDSGREVARYDKMHMFDVDVDDAQRNYQESATFEPGEDLVVIDSPVGRVGLSVCYDIRFPELYRKLDYPDLITVPSAFTRPTGQAHFQLLMQARAVENQCYVIAASQGGEHDSGRQTHGHSMLVDPWGQIVAEAPPEGEAVIFAEIDLDRVKSVRSNMPTQHQRRLD